MDEHDLGMRQPLVVANSLQAVVDRFLTRGPAGNLLDGDRQRSQFGAELLGHLIVDDHDGIGATTGRHRLDRHDHQGASGDLESWFGCLSPVPQPQSGPDHHSNHR